MGADTAAYASGAEWKAIVQKNGVNESVVSSASNVVLETST
jgi:hypothetical protein